MRAPRAPVLIGAAPQTEPTRAPGRGIAPACVHGMEWGEAKAPRPGGPARGAPPVTDAYFIMDELLPGAGAPSGPPLIDYGAGAHAGAVLSSAPGVYSGQPSMPPPSFGPLAPVAIARPVAAIERGPMRVFCPHCAHAVETRTTLAAGAASWLACVLLLPGAFCCACLVPFVVPWFKDVHHHCPSCRAEIAVHRRL